eukprot:GEZU01027804.1.p1 GENE.GEZU01027804.1~~GEZU01027804.1.p1  ORF type:complete len:162 (-),score=39.57 GEZU01027804.1:59-544(-)
MAQARHDDDSRQSTCDTVRTDQGDHTCSQAGLHHQAHRSHPLRGAKGRVQKTNIETYKYKSPSSQSRSSTANDEHEIAVYDEIDTDEEEAEEEKKKKNNNNNHSNNNSIDNNNNNSNNNNNNSSNLDNAIDNIEAALEDYDPLLARRLRQVLELHKLNISN